MLKLLGIMFSFVSGFINLYAINYQFSLTIIVVYLNRMRKKARYDELIQIEARYNLSLQNEAMLASRRACIDNFFKMRTVKMRSPHVAFNLVKENDFKDEGNCDVRNHDSVASGVLHEPQCFRMKINHSNKVSNDDGILHDVTYTVVSVF